MSDMEKTIEIPEGYEARIEGNKVILESKESEDERIKKELIKFIFWAVGRGSVTEKQRERSNFWIAWLEKQGSQNLANSAKTCKDEQNPIFRVGDYIRNTKTGDKVLIEQLDIATKAYWYVSYDGAAVNHSDIPFSQQDEWTLIGQKTVEQNPAWSKEDEEHVNSLLKRLEGLCRKELTITRFAVNEDEDWLKSLKDRYTWKPSDEQMS